MELTYWQGQVLNWSTVAMLTVDSRLWFVSRGERGGCCQNQQHWGYHAAQGCSRCHCTHACLETSRELGAGALEKKKEAVTTPSAPSTYLLQASGHIHWVAQYRGKSCSPMALAQTSLMCRDPTAVSVFGRCGRGRVRTAVPMRISLKIWICSALCLLC